MIKFLFSTQADFAASVVESIIKAPVEHPKYPGLWSTRAFVRMDPYPVDSSAVIQVEFPDPKPDIPALIRMWHFDPTDANRRTLAQAIRNDGKYAPSYYPSYQTEDATYWVDNSDCICVGPWFVRGNQS